MLLILQPPAQARPAVPPPKPVPLAQAVQAVLEAYEDGQPLPAPPLAARHRAAMAWLKGAAQEDRPANPFPPGSAAQAEARTLLRLLAAFEAGDPADLSRLELKEPGSQLLLWRWGRARARQGALPRAPRIAWEDRLMRPGCQDLLRTWALRHALCFALAEGDEDRFTALKGRLADQSPELFAGFQRLFAMLGGPSPSFRLWSLPGVKGQELRLDQLGASRVWVHPALPGTGPWARDVAWVVPAALGLTDAKDTAPQGEDQIEAEVLSGQFHDQGWQGWYAPTRREWTEAGLAFFPILLELDGQGRVTRIRMGDAAPQKP